MLGYKAYCRKSIQFKYVCKRKLLTVKHFFNREMILSIENKIINIVAMKTNVMFLYDFLSDHNVYESRLR